jgi:purine-nucleoside phosphorylase
VRDVVLAMTSSTMSTPSRGMFRELSFAPSADFGSASGGPCGGAGQGSDVHVGGIYSSDVFYDERPDLTEQLTRHGVLAVEMEAAELIPLRTLRRTGAGGADDLGPSADGGGFAIR